MSKDVRHLSNETSVIHEQFSAKIRSPPLGMLIFIVINGRMVDVIILEKISASVGDICLIISTKEGEKKMNYYIADTHFGHDNIRRLSNRPFKTIEEMDRTIIDNWNSRVSDNDDVYILGDFSYKSEDPISYLKQLNGRKYLIIGNHDSKLLKNPACKKYFVDISDIKMVNDNGTQIVCCHYPMVEWNGYYRNVIHFYGHIHNNFDNETNQYISKVKNAYNVGVDIIGFMPRTLKEILENN